MGDSDNCQRLGRTTIVSDAVSSYMPDLHAAVLKNFALKFGWVATAEEVIAVIRGGDGAAGRGTA